MILDRLRRKKKKAPEIPRNEFLKIKPVRNPNLKWEKNKDGEVTIFIPLEQPPTKKKKKRKKGLFSKISSTPKEKRVQLDSVGSIVWSLCDGEKTVKDIVEYLHKKYKLLTNEAEISLNAYFNQLSKRGLIGFILPEETRARLEKAAKEEKKKPFWKI